MLNKEQIYQIMDFCLQRAKGYATRVLVFSDEEGLTRFANSEIHQNMLADKTEVVITIQDGKKISEISTTSYDEKSLENAVLETIDNLQFVPEGEFEIPLVEDPQVLEVEEFNHEMAEIYDIDGRAKLIKAGIELLAEGYLAYGALSHQKLSIGFANSKGVKRFAGSNSVNFSTLVSSTDGGSGYAEYISSSLKDIDVIGGFKTAYDKAKANHQPEQLEPGSYTVILEPLAVGEMLAYMSFLGFSAQSVQNKQSFLTGRIGERVFDERITVTDDHTHQHTMTLPFDFEGYPRKKVKVIENGVAKELVYDTISALKADVETTGHSIKSFDMGGIPIHIVMAPGENSLKEIIAGTEKGLLVTRFHYLNIVNPRQAILTALTRDGVFKIEQGQIVGAVKNMRFTESMLKAFNHIEAISKERQRVKFYEGSLYVPALKISNFHFTGKTNA